MVNEVPYPHPFICASLVRESTWVGTNPGGIALIARDDSAVPYPCPCVGGSTWAGANPGGAPLITGGDLGMPDGEVPYPCAFVG